MGRNFPSFHIWPDSADSEIGTLSLPLRLVSSVKCQVEKSLTVALMVLSTVLTNSRAAT